jgi:hypothetical protein
MEVYIIEVELYVFHQNAWGKKIRKRTEYVEIPTTYMKFDEGKFYILKKEYKDNIRNIIGEALGVDIDLIGLSVQYQTQYLTVFDVLNGTMVNFENEAQFTVWDRKRKINLI